MSVHSILTVGDLIARLEQLRSVYGDIPVTMNDLNVGYLQGIHIHVTKSTKIEEGIYDHPKWRDGDDPDQMGQYVEDDGDETICVLEWVGTQ